MTTAHGIAFHGVSVWARQRALEDLGLEFDAEAAEWMRWYAELRDSSQSSMYGSGQGATFYLHNWWAPCLNPGSLWETDAIDSAMLMLAIQTDLLAGPASA